MRKWIKCLVIVGLIVLLSITIVACSAPASPMTSEPLSLLTETGGKMVHQKVQLTNKQADGYIIPLGPANIVCVITDVGMLGCGAFDVMALDAFTYPAARVKSSSGKPIATIDDLLDGVVKETNAEATKRGINVGMSGREALDLL